VAAPSRRCCEPLMRRQTGGHSLDNATTSAVNIMTTPSAPLRRLRTFFLLAQPPVLFQEGTPCPGNSSRLLSVGTWLRAIFWHIIYSMTMPRRFKSWMSTSPRSPTPCSGSSSGAEHHPQGGAGAEEVISYQIRVQIARRPPYSISPVEAHYPSVTRVERRRGSRLWSGICLFAHLDPGQLCL